MLHFKIWDIKLNISWGCIQMSSKDVGHGVHYSRPAVKGFAEFCCSPAVADKNKESSELRSDFGSKVSCTKLQYTYPVRTTYCKDILHTV